MAEPEGVVDHYAEILEAAFEAFDEGIVVVDVDAHVLLWNHAATEITGYLGAEMLSRSLPPELYQVDPHPVSSHNLRAASRPVPVHLLHQRGHTLPAMLRRTPLRDAIGKRFGTLLRFHIIDELDALPHGENSEDSELDNQLEHSQADMEDRLDEAFQEWNQDGVPFGLLWITVDQAAHLRRTHGRDAAEAMMQIVERTLVHALRPTEILGRWGSNEFLVLCHERTLEMMDAHAQRVGALARTADFRWWGDRTSLTVSVGAAQAEANEKLGCLLKRAQKLMETSRYAGGNQATTREIPGTRGQECSQL